MHDSQSQPKVPEGEESERAIFLSVVIPVYNEEDRLPETLESVFAFLETQPYRSEVLVVDNGSRDQTNAVAKSFVANHPSLRVLREQRRGKGLAVRRGMLEARGQFRFLCDADLSTPIDQVSRFLPPALEDFDIAVASRELEESIVIDKPYRRTMGRTFNALTRAMGLTELRDTQCGFKCFRAAIAEDVFSRQTLNGLSFDVEVLYIARSRSYRIVEVPVSWSADPQSRVRLLRDSLQMGWDLLKIRHNAKCEVYRK